MIVCLLAISRRSVHTLTLITIKLACDTNKYLLKYLHRPATDRGSYFWFFESLQVFALLSKWPDLREEGDNLLRSGKINISSFEVKHQHVSRRECSVPRCLYTARLKKMKNSLQVDISSVCRVQKQSTQKCIRFGIKCMATRTSLNHRPPFHQQNIRNFPGETTPLAAQCLRNWCMQAIPGYCFKRVISHNSHQHSV